MVIDISSPGAIVAMLAACVVIGGVVWGTVADQRAKAHDSDCAAAWGQVQTEKMTLPTYLGLDCHVPVAPKTAQ